MPDDHSDVVPLLPISNRTVKRVSADDSAGSCVKVGHRQALIPTTPQFNRWGVCLCAARLCQREGFGRAPYDTLMTQSPSVRAAPDRTSAAVMAAIVSLMSAGLPVGTFSKPKIRRAVGASAVR